MDGEVYINKKYNVLFLLFNLNSIVIFNNKEYYDGWIFLLKI